jgi:hypothetical protein
MRIITGARILLAGGGAAALITPGTPAVAAATPNNINC